MGALQWLKWLCIGLLAAGLSLATTGCGDDDDGDNSGDVTTAEADTGGDATPDEVNTGEDDVVAEPAADEGDDEVVLVAAQLIEPANGTVFRAMLPGDAKFAVNFRWTAVPGAQTYTLRINNVYFVPGTTITRELPYGDYEWSVGAQNANASAPRSETFTFSIRPNTIPL